MFSLLILPGDGIGPEVMTEVKRVISWFQDKRNVKIDIEEGLVGGASYDKHGVPLTEEILNKALGVDAVLLGAVGGPNYDNLSFDLKPERALLKLRKELDLYACVRPVRWFRGTPAAILNPQRVDFVLFRENTEDVYAGIEFENGSDEANKIIELMTEFNQSKKIRFPETSSFGIKPISKEGSITVSYTHLTLPTSDLV